MRGKYITTNIRLAVKSGSKKMKMTVVNETTASINNYQPIWTKAADVRNIENAAVTQLAKAV